MDAPSLSPERSTELAALRRRAYGPDADIHQDPEAQARLSELEHLARPMQATPEPEPQPEPEAPAEEISGQDAASGPPVDVVPSDLAPPPVESKEPALVVPARPWWKGGRPWAVAAVAAIVGIVGGIAIGAAVSAESQPAARLVPAPGEGDRGNSLVQTMDHWGIARGSLVSHGAFEELDVWMARGIDESRCLLLSSAGTFLSATCASAGFEPILDFNVFDESPLSVNVSLPVGTVIRFIGGEDAVDVWVHTPGEPSL